MKRRRRNLTGVPALRDALQAAAAAAPAAPAAPILSRVLARSEKQSRRNRTKEGPKKPEGRACGARSRSRGEGLEHT